MTVADAARDLIRRSTRASGVPLTLEDPVTLDRVVVLLSPNANRVPRRAPDSDDAPTTRRTKDRRG